TRREDGVYLQTWHGTPLKKLFEDLPVHVGRDQGYADRVRKSIDQWTHLLSPSPYATSCFQSGLRHSARVLETGYPRNDVLFGERLRYNAAWVRERLNIPTDKTVVLYAPTFRDNNARSPGKFDIDFPFELTSISDGLGDDYVVLVRSHFLIKSRLSIPDTYENRLKDVSRFDEVNDLLSASDLLVTDYSSVLFDYLCLARPVLFFAYDLELYRDQVRGFYLDYENDLPGPLVKDVDELVNAIHRTVS